MSPRVYKMHLPAVVPSFMIAYAIDKLQGAGVWHEVPAAFKKKIADAQNAGNALDITKADLDTLPDHLWNVVEHMMPSA